jgi:protein-arginine kinase activator protein McsA
MFKEDDTKCKICKKGIGVVTTNGLLWCANCYTTYLLRISNKRRVKSV